MTASPGRLHSLAQGDAILETLEEVIAWQALVQNALDPLPGLVRSAGGVLVEAQLAQVSIQRRHRCHGGRLSADQVVCVSAGINRPCSKESRGATRANGSSGFSCVSAPMGPNGAPMVGYERGTGTGLGSAADAGTTGTAEAVGRGNVGVRMEGFNCMHG